MRVVTDAKYVPRFRKIGGKWYFVYGGLMTEVTRKKSVKNLERRQALWEERRDELFAEIDKLKDELNKLAEE